MIREAQLKDADQLAALHVTCLPNDFLSSLGSEFLTLLYKSMLKNNVAFGAVEEEAGKIRAFAVATTDSEKTFKTVYFRSFIPLSTAVLKQLLKRIRLLGNVIQTFTYNKKFSKKDLPISELLFIGTHPDYQNKGIGTKLINYLNRYYQKIDIGEYKVCLYQEHKIAEKFYKKLQFKPNGKFELYGKRWKIYTKKL